MKVNIVLADVGTQDSVGKLNLLGAGWSQTQVGPNGRTPDMSIAIFVEIPWDRANREILLIAELIDEDGQAVTLPTSPDQAQPVRIEHRPVAGPPLGAPNGSPAQVSMLINMQGGLPLQPGRWYSWRVSVDGEQREDWQAKFYVSRLGTAPTFGRPVG
ncbi:MULTISPECIES: DUF6941 family protein [Micromonospora]|uniref:DUF6941 family protein n=1 Tax=Micromonospora TaxID=1873 RepID=UPI0033D073D0